MNMWIVVLIAATGLGLLLRSSYERKTLSVSEYVLETDKVRSDRTFVFLSDLHDNCFGEGQKDLLRAIEKANPEAVLIGGDMMVVKKGADTHAALFLIEKLAEKYPIYYGNGNHEMRMDQRRSQYGETYDIYRRRLQEIGVVYLSDYSVQIDDQIQISGLNIDSPYYKRFKPDVMDTEYIEQKLGKAKRQMYQILLAHSPLYHETYSRWGADLALCGHFHGGTVRIPGLGGLMTPQYQFFKQCCGGIHWREGKAMIVSRGLGTHSINIRLNNKPELIVIRIRRNVYRRQDV